MRRRPGIAGIQRDAHTRVRHHYTYRVLRRGLTWRSTTSVGVAAAPTQHRVACKNGNAHACCMSHPFSLEQEQYRSTGEEVRRATLQQMKDQLALFKSKLEEFAIKHKADIRRDPVFRAQFHTMCANIGVDPLASNKVRGWSGCSTCGQQLHRWCIPQTLEGRSLRQQHQRVHACCPLPRFCKCTPQATQQRPRS